MVLISKMLHACMKYEIKNQGQCKNSSNLLFLFMIIIIIIIFLKFCIEYS